MRLAPLTVLILAAGCRTAPKPSDLAAYLPSDASIVAGFDVGALRNTPLFPRLPENYRDASYVMAAIEPPNIVTASLLQGRIEATTSKSTPPDLARHATAAPIWIAVRGTAQLPLPGNLANINRLLAQTDYTVISIKLTDKAEFAADAICRTPEAANHLDQNLRAIATLAKLELQSRSEARTVHVTANSGIEDFLRVFSASPR